MAKSVEDVHEREGEKGAEEIRRLQKSSKMGGEERREGRERKRVGERRKRGKRFPSPPREGDMRQNNFPSPLYLPLDRGREARERGKNSSPGENFHRERWKEREERRGERTPRDRKIFVARGKEREERRGERYPQDEKFSCCERGKERGKKLVADIPSRERTR